jgi:hypothetical protein
MSPRRATGRSIELPPGSVAAYGHLQQNDLMEDGGVGSARRSFDDCFLSRFQKGTRWVEVEALTRWVEASSLLSMVPNLTTQVLITGCVVFHEGLHLLVHANVCFPLRGAGFVPAMYQATTGDLPDVVTASLGQQH